MIPEPTRPAFGCTLDRATARDMPLSPKGRWIVEPKFNGWRVVVDTATGKCYSRHGARLSEEPMFKRAVEQVSDMLPNELVDCEGLGKRHGLAKGSLIVLDRMIPRKYYPRTDPIRVAFPDFVGDAHQLDAGCPDKAFCCRTVTPQSSGNMTKLLEHMQAFNDETDCIFYEGVVAKRIDTPYEYGETNNWRKFRFTYKA